MMVVYVLRVRKAIGVVEFDYTASFMALNNEGSENVFICFICNVKLIQHLLIKLFCVKLGRINHAKMNERPPKLSL